MSTKAKKVTKKTVGMAVRPEYRNNLEKFKPDSMTLTEYWEIMVTWVLDNKHNFIPVMHDYENGRLEKARIAANLKSKAKYEAELRSNDIMFGPIKPYKLAA